MSEYAAVAGKFAEVQKGLTNRFAGEKETTGQIVESAGATTLLTPAASKFITLYWIWLFSSQENSGEVTATVKLGSKTAYVSYLGNPGAFAHWEPIAGSVGDKLILELSGPQKVAVSYTYSEMVP